MTAEERLLNAGYDGVVYLTNYSYDDALIGVSEDGRAVYDFDKMVTWLMREEGFSAEDAIEWIEYNTIRAITYAGSNAPIIMYQLQDDPEEQSNASENQKTEQYCNHTDDGLCRRCRVRPVRKSRGGWRQRNHRSRRHILREDRHRRRDS